jgi:hypothetical protein
MISENYPARCCQELEPYISREFYKYVFTLALDGVLMVVVVVVVVVVMMAVVTVGG